MTACWIIWLWISSRRSMRASSAPIWRLKPTMSVNMKAASLRVSAVAVGDDSPLMRAIMRRASPGCQIACDAWQEVDHDFQLRRVNFARTGYCGIADSDDAVLIGECL